MEDLILYIARLLVDRPEAVQVREVRGRQGTVYRLIVHPRDRGKIIGKEGRTIEAIRAILEAAAARRGLHITLDVV
jgi:predicted RNA-binding protein YlqC (UPF0109 family)